MRRERLPAACVPSRSRGCLDGGTSGAACQRLFSCPEACFRTQGLSGGDPPLSRRPVGPRTPLGCGRAWDLAGLTARHAGPIISKDTQTSGPALSLLWGAAPVPGAWGALSRPSVPHWEGMGVPFGKQPRLREATTQVVKRSAGFNHKSVPGLRALLQTQIPLGSRQGTPRGTLRGTPRGSMGCR